MHIVVSTVPLTRPLGPEVIARLERELPLRVGDRSGYRGVYGAKLVRRTRPLAAFISGRYTSRCSA